MGDAPRVITVALVVLAVAACGDAGADAELETDGELTADTAALVPTDAAAGEQRVAVVQLEPTEGSSVEGTVTLTEVEDGINVSATVRGLEEGEHGFHIHETGDCSAPDASSAGGHFAPEGSQHGGPDQQPPQAHVGDMGNLVADASGRATYDRDFTDMMFDGERGIGGRAVIVHAGRDDLESQPSGDAGARMACGVIEVAQGGAAGASDTAAVR